MDTLNPLIRNNVTVTGNPQSTRTLVFVHGFGTDQSAWRDVCAPLGADHRIVLLDNVGAGGSAPQAFVQHRYLDLHRYANDLLEVCHALDVQGGVMIGHSAGAMVGALAALREPQRFDKLVLIGASPRYMDEPGYHGGFTTDGLNALYRAVSASPSDWADQFAPAAMGNADRPSLAQHFADTIKRIPKEQVLTVLCAIFQSDHRAEIARLTQPTLLIQARDDIAVPLEVAQYLHAHIRDSRLEVVNASGHLPHISAPLEVLRVLLPFLRE